MRGFYPASFFLESEKLLVLKQAQVPIPMWSNLYNVIECTRSHSQLKFSEILFDVCSNSNAKQYEILRICSLSMMEMESQVHYYFEYVDVSTNSLPNNFSELIGKSTCSGLQHFCLKLHKQQMVHVVAWFLPSYRHRYLDYSYLDNIAWTYPERRN